jgi:hypothetical protein
MRFLIVISVRRTAILIEVFRSFLQSLQIDVGIMVGFLPFIYPIIILPIDAV